MPKIEEISSSQISYVILILGRRFIFANVNIDNSQQEERAELFRLTQMVYVSVDIFNNFIHLTHHGLVFCLYI